MEMDLPSWFPASGTHLESRSSQAQPSGISVPLLFRSIVTIAASLVDCTLEHVISCDMTKLHGQTSKALKTSQSWVSQIFQYWRWKNLCRYEDNGDSVNNLNVLVTKSDKNDIGGYGDPKAFLEQINYIFGDQVFIGAALSAPQLVIQMHCSLAGTFTWWWYNLRLCWKSF